MNVENNLLLRCGKCNIHRSTSMKLLLFNAPRAGFCMSSQVQFKHLLRRCVHQCVYCHAVKFPNFVGPAQPQLKLLEQIESMVRNTKLRLPVMMSN